MPPEINNQNHHLPENDALWAARTSLGKAIAALEPYCQTPPDLKERYLMWFTPSEVPAVNEVWAKQGIEAVIQRWGAERRYHNRDDRPEFIPEERQLRFLSILQLEPNSSGRRQSTYYRAALLELPSQQEAKLLQILQSHEILAAVIPSYDPVLKVSLQPDAVVGARCRLQWYGPDNIYGKGVVFGVDLLLPANREFPYSARFEITETGQAHAYLFAAELVETGYDGHEYRSVTLSALQLNALQEFISSQNKLAPTPRSAALGTWLGESLVE